MSDRSDKFGSELTQLIADGNLLALALEME